MMKSNGGTAMSYHDFEVRKLTIKDLSVKPQCFQNDQDGNAIMGKAAQYAQFFAEGIKNPVYYFRNINPNSQRWAGISEFGDGPLEPQRGLHGEDIAQEDAPTIPYRKVSDDPVTYEIVSDHPYSKLQFMDDGKGGVVAHFQEGENGSILDLKVEPFPVAVFSHSNSEQPTPYFQVNTVVSGTYMGKPVQGMGGFDRTFIVNRAKGDTEKEEKDYAATYRCNCALYSGVREDGRKECVYALITTENGKGIGMYYIDGEEPLVTDEVYLDTKFQYLPYVNDGTVVYTNATWTIGSKKIHFNGKWGTKSFTAYPKIEKHGQSQCFGTWYVGDIPYKHVISHTFNENSGDAYADRMAQMGFEVIEK
jgi:hypothetical protein